MPMLYSLGQHGALQEVQYSLGPDEYLFAYLDDIYVVCPLERVSAIYKLLGQAFKRTRESRCIRARRKLGTEAATCSQGVTPCRLLLNVSIRKPSHVQGNRVLGIPIGSTLSRRQAQLRSTTEKYKVLHERLLLVQDLQSACFLLLFCANAWARVLVAWNPAFRRC